MNPQSLVVKQEELALPLPEEPTMPTLDSQGYHEWIKMETLTLPAPSPLCQLLPDPFVLPLLKIHINISKHFQQWQQ